MKMLFTNNSRRFAGKAVHRKGKGKRYKTRCEQIETVDAFINYCNWR